MREWIGQGEENALMAMKWHFEFIPDWRDEPMAYWIHVENDAKPWLQALSFDPPAPRPVAGRGFAVLCVEVGAFTFRFSSPEQLRACMSTLSAKPLPSSLALSARRPGGAGPNSHWLSRLPARIKSPKSRAKAVEALRRAQEESLATAFGRNL